MNRRGARISNSNDPRDIQNLIGKENLDAINPNKKVEWSLRGMVTFVKILKDSLAKSKMAFLFRKVLSMFDVVTMILIGLTLIAGQIGKKRYLKAFVIFLLALVLVSIGLHRCSVLQALLNFAH